MKKVKIKKIKIKKVIGKNILILKVYGFDIRCKHFPIQVRYRVGSDISLLHSCMSDQKFRTEQLEDISDFDVDVYDINLFKKVLFKEVKLINNMKYRINRYSLKKSIDRDILNYLYERVQYINNLKELIET